MFFTATNPDLTEQELQMILHRVFSP
jgi:hypothetical protein